MNRTGRLFMCQRFLQVALAICVQLFIQDLNAACGGTTRTWNGSSSTAWALAANWTAANIPDTATEDAVIVSAARAPLGETATVGCVDIQSGTLTGVAAKTITVVGDYFKNPFPGSLTVAAGTTYRINMAGTVDQELQNYDTLQELEISSNKTVTLSNPFTIRTVFSMTGTGTVVRMNGDVRFTSTATVITIPSSVTVEVGNGVIFTALGGLTVNGTLKINPGGSVVIGTGRTLSVGAGGLLQIAGSAGNAGSVVADGSGTFTFNVLGNVNANYFKVSRTTAAGMNVTGTIQALSNGDFSYIASAGYGITLGAAAVVPTTMDSIGFFDTANFANNRNVNATAYNLTATSFTNYAGMGGAAKEMDPNSKINWGTAAPTKLTVLNNSPSGIPTASIAQARGPNHFVTFAFALNATDVATNITSVTVSNAGTATSGDIDYIQVFKDVNANCTYNAGVDTQVGSNLTMSGSPPKATATFAPGDVQTSSTTPGCIHVLVRTTAKAKNAKTIAMEISATGDVVNSAGYSFSDSSGPPISGDFATIAGDAESVWFGGTSNAWNTNANWVNGTRPTAARDCRVGSGVVAPLLTASVACQNEILQTGGTINFNNGAFALQVYAMLEIQPGFTFSNAANGSISMLGTGNQSLKIDTTFPGSLSIANTGTAPNNIVGVDSDSVINGNLTVTTGQLSISSGKSLTVLGNVTVATGATLTIAPNARLILGNGSVVTINNGGTLSMIGSSSQSATMTSSSTSNAYTVVVNGTIKAQYYKFERLGANGVTINSAATIDPTYHLQNGNFSYPVANNANMLRLFKKVPTNTMDNMTFDANGSSATGTKNIYLDNVIAAPSENLTITSYTGSFSGPTYENDGATNYSLVWTGATNTIDLTQEATGPTTVAQGTTYVMGRFGFKQTLSGGSYLDTNITSLKLTLTGTGSANDVSQVRAYYSSGCTNTGGVLIGSGTFTGNPGTITMSGISGATIEQSGTPKRCVYVEYDVAGGAGVGSTLGVMISGNGDLVTSQSYTISGNTPPPVNLGTAATVTGSNTNWVGTTSTDWFTASNWSSGVPTSALNCNINSGTFQPTIGSGTASCKSLTLNTGTLTMSAGTTLRIYGSFSQVGGTFSQNATATVDFTDSGSSVNQTISTTTNSIGTITVNKPSGGTIIASPTNFTISNLTMVSGTGEWQVPSGKNLTLTNGLTASSGTFTVQSGGTLKIPSTKLITVNGGTFKTTGTNDAYPQSTANKAKVTNNGSGTWGFTATSGTVNLTGFIFEYIDTNGLNIGGTTNLTNLNGGQFVGLSTSYASVKAIQLNTSGTIPSTASNIGWMWGAANSPPSDPPTAPAPGTSQSYLLASSTGCGNQTISFDQWFGDFFAGVNKPDTATKVSATNCTINIAASASPVAITSLTAVGYDAAVAVNWETGSELDHAGFNVYRRSLFDTNFIQINSSLIRNTYTSTLSRGQYRYVDTDVTNGQTYYYQVEDVAINGVREMHGPVSATPLIGLGAVPAAGGTTSEGSSLPGAGAGNSPVVGPITNDNLVDLGNGIHLLAKTQNSMRVEIIVPAVSIQASAWNASYSTLTVPGYSNTLNSGYPELLERTILIEIDEEPSSVTSQVVTLTEAAIRHSILVAPAPSWSPDGAGNLQPSWSPNATAYSTSAYSPSSYYSLNSTTRQIGNKHYIELKISPFMYNPGVQDLSQMTRLVLDIGMNGSAWTSPTPPSGVSITPNLISGSLRIRFNRTGMYEVSYDDIEAAGLDGPWSGKATSDFRLFQLGKEIPLEVDSPSGNFTNGDKIHFYGYHYESTEEDFSEVVLTVDGMPSSSGSPLRILTINGDPSSFTNSDEMGSWRKATAEQNNLVYFNTPIGDSSTDHFFWGRIISERGAAYDSYSYLNTTIDLPGLQSNSSDSVQLKVYVLGGRTQTWNANHHLGVLVNNTPTIVADAQFDSDEPTVLNLTIPSHYFFNGTNTVKFQALADLVPNGYHDMIYIDKFEVTYRANWQVSAGFAEFSNRRPNTVLNVSGFSDVANARIYDITNLDTVSLIANASISTLNQTLSFAAVSDFSGNQGNKYIVLEPTAFLAPTSIMLSSGVSQTFKNNSMSADLVIVGPKPLLDAATELIAHRRAQGLRVIEAPLDQVYDEFSNGLQSTQAIKDFITWTQTNWVVKPKYLLILGDATFDPKNFYENDVTPLSSQPLPIVKGAYVDFGSDHWYVANGNNLPELSVGRIPTSNPSKLEKYINKLIAYENGSLSPILDAAKKVILVNDKSTMNEGFDKQAVAIANTLQAANNKLSTGSIDRSLETDAQTKASIIQSFDDGPLMITYIGHGAEDRWADGSVFTNTEAQSLTNSKLPIVVALNCLNSYFYDADPTYVSLGEELLFNENGGAIAFWGSTTMTAPTTQTTLAKAFFDRIGLETKKAQHIVRIGDLATGAKISLGSSPATNDTLESWTLFGDPSMVLPSDSFTGTSEDSSKASPGGCGSMSNLQPPPSGRGPTNFLILLIMLLPIALTAYLRRET